MYCQNVSFSSARIYCFNNADPIKRLPKEIVLKIFGYFSAIDLAKLGNVCKQWRILTFDPTLWNALEIPSSAKIFDETDWAKYVDLESRGLIVEDAPLLDKRSTILFLEKCLSSPIEGEAGVTLLTIPKGFTLAKLVEIGKSVTSGNVIFKRLGLFLDKIQDVPVAQTYRIVITNNIFKDSRGLKKIYCDCEPKEAFEKLGCKIPKLLEAGALLVLTFMKSGERLYTNNPSTYTRCSSKVSYHNNEVFNYRIGDFSALGISIYTCISGASVGYGGVWLLPTNTKSAIQSYHDEKIRLYQREISLILAYTMVYIAGKLKN